MPARVLPTSFTAGRAMTLAGVSFVPGDTVSVAQAKSGLGKQLGLYVSRGFLVPNVPQYNRTARRGAPVLNRLKPVPFYLSPTEYRALS